VLRDSCRGRYIGPTPTILYINSLRACVRASVSDTTVPRFNPPAEPALTVGFGKRDSARTVGFRERDSENGADSPVRYV
jgi:hypothetical protein